MPTDSEQPQQQEDPQFPPLAELLLELADEDDPWVFLQRVKNEIVAGPGGNSGNIAADRTACINMFYAKAAVKSESEREALIAEAKQVFRIPLQTMRNEIDRLSEVGATVSRMALCVVGRNEHGEPEWICETVRTNDAEHPVKYKKFVFQSAADPDYHGEPDLLTEVKVGNVLFQPIDAPQMLLPTGTEDYGSEEDLFNDVLVYLRRIFCFPEFADSVMTAGYVMMTWLYDRLPVLGYLRLLGMFETGKTHLLLTAGNACYHPIISLGTMSAAVVFRSLDKVRGTLVVDEGDINKNDEDMFRILNGGYQDGVRVPRCVGDDNEPHCFNVFGPKILDSRREFADEALESRCWRIDMQSVPAEALDGWFPDSFTENQKAQAEALHNKLLLWRFRKYQQTRYDEFATLPVKVKRGKQIAKAILACINTPLLRGRLIANLDKTSDSLKARFLGSKEGKVIAVFLDLIKDKNGGRNYSKRVAVSELCARLNAGKLPDDTLSEWKVGKVLGHDGLGFELARTNKGNGYIGGRKLRDLVERYEL